MLRAGGGPHRDGDDPSPAATAQDPGDVAGLEARARADGEKGGAHHAPRDVDLERGEARGVQHDEPHGLAAREVAQGAGRHRGEVGVLVGEDVTRAGEALDHARVPRAHHGHDLVSHVGPQVARVGVGAVLAPDDAAHPQQVAELLVGAIEQGAHDAVAAARNPEAGAPGAANRVHEEGLRAVVGGVGREDARGGARRAEALGEVVRQARRLGVAQLPAGVLDVVAGACRERRDVGAADRAGCRSARRGRGRTPRPPPRPARAGGG